MKKSLIGMPYRERAWGLGIFTAWVLAVLMIQWGCWIPRIPWPPATPTPTATPTPEATPTPTPEPTPTPTPEPTPTPPPEPTPEPTPAAGLTHIKIVWYCGGATPRGCFANGADWSRPAVVDLATTEYRIGDPPHPGVRVYASATYMMGDIQVHRPDPAAPSPIDQYYPGGIPEFREDGQTKSWLQSYPPDLRFDCGLSRPDWGDRHNYGACTVDFAGQNGLEVCAHGVCGSSTVTAR